MTKTLYIDLDNQLTTKAKNNFERAYFIKWTWTQIQTLRNRGPWTFKKSGPHTKIVCMS